MHILFWHKSHFGNYVYITEILYFIIILKSTNDTQQKEVRGVWMISKFIIKFEYMDLIILKD